MRDERFWRNVSWHDGGLDWGLARQGSAPWPGFRFDYTAGLDACGNHFLIKCDAVCSSRRDCLLKARRRLARYSGRYKGHATCPDLNDDVDAEWMRHAVLWHCGRVRRHARATE